MKHAIKEYEFDCKARKLGVNTIQGYMRMLRYLMDYLDKEYDITQIEDVKPFHIKHFLLLKQEEGKKPQYINDLLKVYKTFFRYLEEEEYLDKAPTAKIHNVKQPKVLIRTFSEDEIRRMLNYCNGRDFVSIRNKALLSILFDTGMRLNEVVSLKREQIHEEYGQLLKALILLGLKVLAEGQRPSEREQLHQPDGAHHQVLRRAVILKAQLKMAPLSKRRAGLFMFR